jgi:glucose/arabinose dehydrogenase
MLTANGDATLTYMFVARNLTVGLALLSLAACDSEASQTPTDGPNGPGPNGEGPTLERIVTGVGFPVQVVAPMGEQRLFIVDKRGTIRVFEDGALLAEPFLDVRDLVSDGNEQGLLSVAFHPGYSANGRLFVYYTDRDNDTQVVEYRVSADPNRVDPNPVVPILSVDQPFNNHNGGLIAFGPDGMLYIALGDGGGGGDPLEAGQSLATLLGALLRIDVDRGNPFTIPADNPFVGQAGARGEIWAYGLRNPWRYSFDRQTGELYIADVGQSDREEVNAAQRGAAGLNYGWNTMEGSECFDPPQGCDQSGLTLPVLDYSHDDGCSVTGGFVYRGVALPELTGLYLYSDFCSGFVRSFRLVGGAATEQREWPELEPSERSVTAFGEDAEGELYIMTDAGNVYKIVPGE